MPTLTAGDIEVGLRRLGLVAGSIVEVHSSLSSFGWVEGGPEAVVAALMRVVTGSGTIVMSAYPVSRAISLTDEERALGIAWKVRLLADPGRDRTGMGAIADAFRLRDDVAIGEGPHPVGAWGRDARAYAEEGYARLLNCDGLALLMGVGIDRLSSMHQAEERVPLPGEIRSRFTVPEEIARRYDPAVWAVGYGSTPGDPWQAVWCQALAAGLVRRERIGASDCALFHAGAIVGLYERMLRNDPYAAFGLSR